MNACSFDSRTRLNVSDGLSITKSSRVVRKREKRITLIGLCACVRYAYSFPSVLSNQKKKFSISFRFTAVNNEYTSVQSGKQHCTTREPIFATSYDKKRVCAPRTSYPVTIASFVRVSVCSIAWSAPRAHIHSQQTFYSCWARLSHFRDFERWCYSAMCVMRVSHSESETGWNEMWR